MGVHWKSSDWDLALSLPWPGFNPNPASRAAQPKKKGEKRKENWRSCPEDLTSDQQEFKKERKEKMEKMSNKEKTKKFSELKDTSFQTERVY